MTGPSLTVEPLLDVIPIGAPVRVKVTLTNRSDSPIEVPETLSLRSGHVTGQVLDPSQTARDFRSIMRCLEEHNLAILKPDQSKSADMTLLRGMDGALFPAPGLHQISVNIAWEIDGVQVNLAGSSSVMVTPPVVEAHAIAANASLSEHDLLLCLAIGGDHPEEGNAALAVAANGDQALDKLLASMGA